MAAVERTLASGVGSVVIRPGVATPVGSGAWRAAQTRLTAVGTSVDLVELGPHVFTSSGATARDAPAYLFVAVASGRLIGDAGGRPFEVLPGQALLVDTRLPMRSEVDEELRLLRVLVTHRWLPGRVAQRAPVAAAVLSDSPVMRASLAAAGTLLRRSSDATVEDDDTAIARLLTGVQLGLLDESSRQRGAGDRFGTRAARRAQIEMHIAAHLVDPAMCAVTIGSALGMSVRSVHNAFGGADDTVGAAIHRQRIEQVLQVVDGSACPPVAAERAAAHGYRDGGQLLRAFRAATGATLQTWWKAHRQIPDP